MAQVVDFSKVGSKGYSAPWFAGGQAKLYIGDIFLDEIVFLEYRESSQKIPIYGYASKLYDTIATGRTIVMGTFGINFKFNGWLSLILKRLFERNYDPQKLEAEYAKNWINQRIERVTQAEESGDVTSENSFVYDLIGELSRNTEGGEKGIQIFNDRVKALRDRIWGSSEDAEKGPSDFSPFDITIHFGVPPAHSTQTGRESEIGSYTANRIEGVSITSEGKRIDLSGDNIIEVYEFLGRQVL
jgi:hypothetical protein